MLRLAHDRRQSLNFTGEARLPGITLSLSGMHESAEWQLNFLPWSHTTQEIKPLVHKSDKSMDIKGTYGDDISEAPWWETDTGSL